MNDQELEKDYPVALYVDLPDNTKAKVGMFQTVEFSTEAETEKFCLNRGFLYSNLIEELFKEPQLRRLSYYLDREGSLVKIGIDGLMYSFSGSSTLLPLVKLEGLIKD